MFCATEDGDEHLFTVSMNRVHTEHMHAKQIHASYFSLELQTETCV